MEEEAKTDVMTSSVTSGDSVTTTSSDNESWTILDEDEAVAEEATEALVLNARVDVVEEVALFSKRGKKEKKRLSFFIESSLAYYIYRSSSSGNRFGHRDY